VSFILYNIIAALWLVWGLYWFAAARHVKPAIQSEPDGTRALRLLPLILCAILFVLPHALLPYPLGLRWLPLSWSWYFLGVALVVAGLALSAWARWHLGANWSGVISLKQGHDLVRTGPYRLLRHPIYAGMLLAMLGSAIAWGDWRGVLAFTLALIAIIPRIGAEDALMAKTFGETYRDYRRRTAAIIPFLI
jgi:protein-S-isoprenylcysteine O-methyltransferase Ste14